MIDPRREALQSAIDQLKGYLLDECPEDQVWEQFDPEVDQLLEQINRVMEGG